MKLIAGPCMAENISMMEEVAAEITEGIKGLGIDYYFKASFDKANRKSVEAERGPGLELGLSYLAGVKDRFNVKTITDVHEAHQCESVAEEVDILQIPAGLCRQTDLLDAAGAAAVKYGRKVSIKKGTALPAKDMSKATKKVRLPQDNVWLCERGTAFGYGDLIVDMRNLAIMADTGHPVIFDCTHSTNKNSKFAPLLAKAAMATGYVDGVFMEVHPNPSKALCDGPCMLTPKQAVELVKQLVDIQKGVRR